MQIYQLSNAVHVEMSSLQVTTLDSLYNSGSHELKSDVGMVGKTSTIKKPQSPSLNTDIVFAD